MDRHGVDQQDVAVVERWGLVAGVTGVTANALLVGLYALAVGREDSPYEWMGPANDVIGGIVSTGATIPVALALRDVVGGGSPVREATRLFVVAEGTIIGLSGLLLVGAIPFAVQGVGAGLAIQVGWVWLLLIGRAGQRTATLPVGLARAARVIGAAALAGAGLAGGGLLLPDGPARYVVAGAGLAVGIPAYLAFPGWLISLSNRLGTHLDSRAAPAVATVR